MFNTSASVHLPPSITDTPGNIIYEVGTTGHEVSWTVEAGETGDSPAEYNVSIDGTVLADHTEKAWQDDQPITVNVDGLDIGVHTVKLTVWDSGYPDNANAATDTVTVEVVEDTSSISGPLSEEDDDPTTDDMPLSLVIPLSLLLMVPVLRRMDI